MHKFILITLSVLLLISCDDEIIPVSLTQEAQDIKVSQESTMVWCTFLELLEANGDYPIWGSTVELRHSLENEIRNKAALKEATHITFSKETESGDLVVTGKLYKCKPAR